MASLQTVLRKGSASLLDLIYPSHCIHCEKRLSAEEKGGLCPACLSQIPKNLPPFCPTCGRSYRGSQGAPRCGACEGKVFPYDRLWFVAPYEGLLREALHILKYKGRKPIADSLAQLLIDFAKETLAPFEYDAILAIPLARDKERGRSFNQSALFVERVSEALAIPSSSGGLIRVRSTRPQAPLTKTERFTNLQEAFRVKDSRYAGKNLLLIDDIVTTGATVSSASKALRTAGAKTISVLTLARGDLTG